jgi:D-glycero-alpha-D-manno-heptose-7-phosphate kinase
MASRGPRLRHVLTSTPLRISFAGGGTDLSEFYRQDYGAVLSTAIDKYLYVQVKRHGTLFREQYRLNYSETETVDRLSAIRNDIARECLRLLKVEAPVYVSTVADVPASSGLGSSSTFAVGLLNALHALQGERVSVGQLAEEAAHIEIDVLQRPIGKQDHYAAAVGGLNYLSFYPDGRVTLEPLHLPDGTLDRLFDHILLFWTGIFRDAAGVLSDQRRNTPSQIANLTTIREHAVELRAQVQKGLDIREFGRLLGAGWQVKRKLAEGISNDQVDAWYQAACEAGALGGKLCGAGGGGFLLFIVPPEQQQDVRHALSSLKEVPIGYEAQGSRILFCE